MKPSVVWAIDEVTDGMTKRVNWMTAMSDCLADRNGEMEMKSERRVPGAVEQLLFCVIVNLNYLLQKIN